MGIDLTLLPDRYPDGPWFLAYDRLALTRDYRLWDSIREVRSHELSPGVRFQWYGDNGIETRESDPYGSPLHWVFAGDLARMPIKRDEVSSWNWAALVFVKTLPTDTRIVLWWH